MDRLVLLTTSKTLASCWFNFLGSRVQQGDSWPSTVCSSPSISLAADPQCQQLLLNVYHELDIAESFSSKQLYPWAESVRLYGWISEIHIYGIVFAQRDLAHPALRNFQYAQ